MVFPGCSALGLAQRPEAALNGPAVLIDSTQAAISEDPEMTEAGAALTAARLDIVTAGQLTRAANACGGRDALGSADSHLAEAQKLTREHIAREEAAQPPFHGEEDVTESDRGLISLEKIYSDLGRTQDGLYEAWTSFDRICEMATPFSMTGTVLSIRDAERQVAIGDLVLGMAEDMDLSGQMTEGNEASLEGLDFGDGTGMITAGHALTIQDAIIGHSCLKFRFVPVQKMAPFFPGPYLMHDPEGYRLGEKYMFEMGMRVAAENICNPGDSTDGAGVIGPSAINEPFKRYSLVVLIDYITREGFAKVDVGIAYDLEPGDTPLPLWQEIDPDEPVQMRVSTIVQECVLANPDVFTPIGSKPELDCGDQKFIKRETYNLAAKERGERCVAIYHDDTFSVNDQVPDHYASTWVTDKIAVSIWDEGTEPAFTAEGYPLCEVNNVWRPCPYVDTIYENHSFSIKNNDFYPVYDTGFEWLKPFTGVDHASGLRWPRVSGTNAGLPWQFSCSLPTVVRDVVNFCDHQADAYYRLPFAFGNKAWTQSQGNKSESTHKGGYAYDMVAACGETIRAARAGIVVQVVESRTQQMADECTDEASCPGHTCCPVDEMCNANIIKIQHQDGSIGEYFHSPKDGIVPEEGEMVHRGETIAFVGTTGRSTGNHLHFGTRPAIGASSHLALFEAVNSEDHTVMQCYEPRNYPDSDSHHYHLRSNNRVWP